MSDMEKSIVKKDSEVLSSDSSKPKVDLNVAVSPRMQKYFEEVISGVDEAYNIAKISRAKGYDPSMIVDIKLAKNLAERVVGLISVIAPQIADTNIVPRILELEKQYGALDWRVAMIVALEVAEEKFCKFKSKKEAMEVGIRTGFAYVTVGVVSSPLEGFTDLEIKKRRDGKEYFCLNFAGPIRNAGGTGASVCVIIGDYVRKMLGYDKYDADEKECERCYREIMDYHERVTNLQYIPSKEEVIFLMQNLPVEIAGIASERIEVANFKDLPRIPTNFIRSGFCLMHSSCIPLKAPKLWKNLGKWGKDFHMEDWNFMNEFLEIQHAAKARSKASTVHGAEKKAEEAIVLPQEIVEIMSEKKPKFDPIFTYVSDLVAGRPVFSHPSRSGGFRLRYGRSRTSGYSAQSVCPATLSVLDNFITTATQLKVERPGKAAAFTVCDSIDGPVVLLKNGSVVEVYNEKQGLTLTTEVKEILYLGDLLVNYGDFFDRAHPLCFPGYCEEWWSQEFEREIKNYIPDTEEQKIPFDDKLNKISEVLNIDVNILNTFLKNPLYSKPSAQISLKLSNFFDKLPLHPKYTYFWSQIMFDDFVILLEFIRNFKFDGKKLVVEYDPLNLNHRSAKRSLELVGIPHFFVTSGNVDIIAQKNETEDRVAKKNNLLPENDPSSVSNDYMNKKAIVVFEEGVALILINVLNLKCSEGTTGEGELNLDFYSYCMGIKDKERELVMTGRLKSLDGYSNIYAINKFSKFKIRDKAGTFIGTRMGRPEKAKMRKMQPPPHVLFPLGGEGGRLKTFQAVLESGGVVNAEFEYYWDEKNGQESVFPVNYKTGEICVKKYWDNKTKTTIDPEQFGPLDREHKPWIKESKRMTYDFKSHFEWCLNKMKTKVFPDLIKGVEGTVSDAHSPENIMKGILRAKYDVAVNKDGTVRYDASEVPITHFKPQEVETSIARLRELGYTHDIYGEPLTRDDQILEMIPQDVILPACVESPNEACDDVFFRVAQYIDDELKFLYDQKPYYNLKVPLDLVGHYIVVLAPHTSAGTIGRIVGFSKTQGLFAHPLMHAAIRRDCDGDEGGIFLLLDAFLNFSTKYLNKNLGATMDAPLVLTSILNPSEVDDMVFNMEVSDKYNLDFYEAALQNKKPWDVKMPLVKNYLGTPLQYEGYKFTHDTMDFNEGVKCSAYKLLPSMKEKLDGQMTLAEKIRATDASDVARIVIEKHFIKDTMGNLRKFSQQEFRCTACGAKYRRPPLSGKCNTCGKVSIIFTVTEGSIKKYVGYSLELAEKYNLPDYLKEVLILNEEYIDSIFGKELEKQEGLSSFF